MTKQHNKKDRSVYTVENAQGLINGLPTPRSNTAVAGVANLAPRTLEKILAGKGVTFISCRKLIDTLNKLGQKDAGPEAIKRVEG